jgi:DNA primase
MAFPDGFVEEVRHAADIVRYISDQVALKKLGASWKGLCPFHNEKTPSFNVRSEPPIFHCFGCGEGGDVFKFAMLHEKVSFPEAVESVARRFGVAVPERTFDLGPGRKEREETLALLEEAAQHFARHLWSTAGQKAREYLLGRGFKKQTLETIRAGAAREAWSDLVDALRGRFPPTALVAAGLALERPSGGGHYDRFRNRVVFPIPNDAGRIVGFGARSIDGSEPKYLNSPETAVYQKSRVLYGLSWAKEAIRRESRVVLMEGYLDVARAHESGIQEAVATCGTALTQSHARLLRRFSERVAVNFDQDEAGQRAAQRSLALLAAEGLDARVAELPEGHDPDSFLKAEGPAAYRERLDRAPRAMEWLIRRSAAENDIRTPPGKAAYLNALLPSLQAIESAVERSAWIPMVVAHGGLDERAAREELSRAIAGRAPAARPAALALAAPPGGKAVARPAEALLLTLVARGAEGVGEALLELAEHEIRPLDSAPILRAARQLASVGKTIDAAALQAVLEGEEDRRRVTALAADDRPLDPQTPRDCIREIRSWPLRARMAALQRDITQATGPALDALLREKNEITRQIAGS